MPEEFPAEGATWVIVHHVSGNYLDDRDDGRGTPHAGREVGIAWGDMVERLRRRPPAPGFLWTLVKGPGADNEYLIQTSSPVNNTNEHLYIEAHKKTENPGDAWWQANARVHEEKRKDASKDSDGAARQTWRLVPVDDDDNNTFVFVSKRFPDHALAPGIGDPGHGGGTHVHTRPHYGGLLLQHYWRLGEPPTAAT